MTAQFCVGFRAEDGVITKKCVKIRVTSNTGSTYTVTRHHKGSMYDIPDILKTRMLSLRNGFKLVYEIIPGYCLLQNIRRILGSLGYTVVVKDTSVHVVSNGKNTGSV